MAIFGDFLYLVFSDMHSKFALKPHHVWKYGRHPISDSSGQKYNVRICYAGQP